MAEAQKKSVSLPYSSYRTFKGYIGKLAETAIPPRIDRSVMKKKSGSVQSQLRTAMRYLGLIDDDQKVLEPMHKLVKAHGGDDWEAALEEIVLEAYKSIIERVPLKTGTSQQLHDAFRAEANMSASSLRKAIRFFLNAAKDAGVTVSPHFAAPSRPRTSRSTSEPKGKKAEKKDEKDSKPKESPTEDEGDGHGTRPEAPSFTDRLLAKFPDFDPGWDDEVKKKWFDAYERMLNMTANGA